MPFLHQEAHGGRQLELPGFFYVHALLEGWFKTLKDFYEEVFLLCYNVKGFTYDVSKMGDDVRRFMIGELVKQRKRESEAMKR